MGLILYKRSDGNTVIFKKKEKFLLMVEALRYFCELESIVDTGDVSDFEEEYKRAVEEPSEKISFWTTAKSKFSITVCPFEADETKTLENQSPAAFRKLVKACKRASVVAKQVKEENAPVAAPTPKIPLDPIAGTRDWTPLDIFYRNYIFDKWRATADAFGFEEYDAPVLEQELLYTTKSGDEICSQMYTFEDKTGNKLAMRPEMTPTLARMVMKEGSSLILPAKWYSLPQCWRWESTTRGRKREFYQLNMDILGVDNINAEAELLATLIWLFRSVKLTSEDIKIRISSRKILDSYVRGLGIAAEKFDAICNCVDRFEKVSLDAAKEQLLQIGVEVVTGDDIRVLAAKNSIDIETTRLRVLLELLSTDPTLEGVEKEKLEKIVDFLQVTTIEGAFTMAEGNGEMREAIKEVSDLFELMDSGYGAGDWLKFDLSIIRGLAYYTGVVFEVFSVTGIQRAVAGGGRYDTLLEIFGGSPLPATGYGFGDVVFAEILKDKNLLPMYEAATQDFVIPFNSKYQDKACEVAMLLREKGRKVDVLMKKYKKIKTAFSYADRTGAERVILVAPEEWQNGCVKVKYLRRDGDEKEAVVKIDELV